jgi:N-acetylmuramoyl-L-alanine amidase
MFKRTVAFILVFTMLLSVQALGFNFSEFAAQAAGKSVNKNYSGALLQSIDSKNLNPDYVSIENGTAARNSKQVIKVGLSVDLTTVSSATLIYQLEGTDKVQRQDTSDIQNGYINFIIKVDSSAGLLGKYKLLDVQLKSKNGSLLNTIDLRVIDASYSVSADESDTAYSSTAENASSALAADASAIVTVSKDKTITGADIGNSVSIVKKAMKSENGQMPAVNSSNQPSNAVMAASGITIVLDPGHGGTQSGAVANGYLEKDLNLKIAQYAQAELETYEGVTVGMTRTSDTDLDLATRASIAKQQGANILVSIHNNASGTGKVYGAEVWVSVLKAYNSSLTVLGNIILDQLHALGIYNRGVKTRPSENGTIFSLTGELADYYGIIRESAYCGFPGIIIEHSFLDNAADTQKYLSSDAKLKQLAIADATALAEYYGLVKKTVQPIPPTGNLAGKLLSSSAEFANMSYATDGDSSNTFNYADSYPNEGLKWVQLDLGAPYDLNHINLWHFYGDERAYHDVVVQLSNTHDFSSGVITVYNNDRDNSAGLGAGNDWEYAESSSGLSLAFAPVNARYVRFYSNGNTYNSSNHYVEIEVYKSDAGSVIHPSSVTFNKTNIAITVGGTEVLTAYVLPDNASNKDVYWSSSDDGVATVEGGIVTAKSAGTATLTGTTVDGLIKASCTVTVV